jgi:uncharacterized protein
MSKTKKEINYDLFNITINKITSDINYKDVSIYIAHSNVNVFEHCLAVAKSSYEFAIKHNVKCDLISLIRGAFLHDYYLYDWHDKINRLPKHGFRHNRYALINASRDFELNSVEQNIIFSHMYPLTFFAFPKCKEAFIVSLMDKKCAFIESQKKHQASYKEGKKAVT